MSVDRTSVVPFYYQLKAILRSDIENRGLRPGDRLPGDHDLCDRFGVSRTVVRQALAELENEGVIERVKGRGTFVAQRKTPQGLVQSLTGLFEDIAAHGKELRSEVRRCEIGPADGQVAADLQIPLGAPVLTLERLRFVDDEPWVLAITHLPAELAPGLERENFEDQSLYALLEGRYGVKLVRGRRSVEADVAGAPLARALGIRRGAAILVLRSVSFGSEGRPVEAFIAFHRGDRSRFEVELSRGPGGGSAAAPLMVVV